MTALPPVRPLDVPVDSAHVVVVGMVFGANRRGEAMAVLGKLLKNRRAGNADLAWNAPNLAGGDELTLTSPDFAHEATIPVVHAGKRIGGEDLSPALSWATVPEGTAQLLLVIEDPDAPTPKPFIHGVFLVEPSVTSLGRGALDAKNPVAGVRSLRSGRGRGYLGPAPIKGHGPHRYVFQLFALAKPITVVPGSTDLDSAKPRAVLAAATDVLARGRIDGIYENP
ncbi:YbhB/YbcL family Raf kinase inhibitor-like protein [Streptomyces silvisoli]|uniref:YbhB/YbcL family Raf kinase inhibitor-like protein n=1 Tax=Streptomyces silvisoli TaxID=3034235 RepID=A0ABT5ZV37_9ACTN|nr:YbhB/YbcL family Raf kinase inhibitor-like protein [Streptomyces silvisoli]MDF3293690.1 YbhB/YbcL family Raf kinase inhibitor-like protein [Streptomyces silvisoli]